MGRVTEITAKEAIKYVEAAFDVWKQHSEEHSEDCSNEWGERDYALEMAIKAIKGVVGNVPCKECGFKSICQKEIKMLGPGIVYECGYRVEGCSLGERIEEDDE